MRGCGQRRRTGGGAGRGAEGPQGTAGTRGEDESRKAKHQSASIKGESQPTEGLTEQRRTQQEQSEFLWR